MHHRFVIGGPHFCFVLYEMPTPNSLHHCPESETSCAFGDPNFFFFFFFTDRVHLSYCDNTTTRTP